MDQPSSSSSVRRSSRKRGRLYDGAGQGLDVVANISEASDILSPLKAACRTTKSILDMIQAVDDNQEELNDITQRLEEYLAGIEDQIDSVEKYPPEERAVDDAFSQPLIHYVKLLEDFHNMVANHKHKRSHGLGIFTAVSKVKIDAGVIRKFNRDIEDRHRQFMEQLGIFTALRVQVVDRSIKTIKDGMQATKADMEATRANVETLLTDVEANAILQLPLVPFVASSVHSTCLQGTREAVLRTIYRWAEDDMSRESIFWLCDIAGSGKSTVAMTVSNVWKTEGILGAQFFFSLASSDASTTEKFCSTMARELAQKMPKLARHVAEAVKRNPAIMRSPFHEQLQILVTEPLRHRQERVILVIDAIDECKSGAQRQELLEALAMAVRETINLKLFITSRPDPIVEAVLRPLSIKAELKDRLHDVRHQDTIDDIATYVHQSLNNVLSLDKRQRLVEKANGLFIWASTACRMLNSKTNLRPPESTYNRLISMEQGGVIDDLYSLILKRTDPEHHDTMYQMLALLLAAYEPVTIEDLDDILKHAGVDGSAKALVWILGSVLIEDATTNLIQFRHPTFIEYLRRRSVIPSFDNHTIDIVNAHGQAASWCLKCLNSPTDGLRFNICQLESSFYLNRQIPDLDIRMSRFILGRLRYASSHWSFHVAETDNNWRHRLENALQYIIRIPRVLHWIEILSFTGGVRRAIAGLRAVTRHPGLREQTRIRIDEIWRFLMTFLVPIQESAPHIYISALPFTPSKSILHIEGVKEYRNNLTVTRGLEEKYPGLPRTLQGHEGPIVTIAFSPDGSRIVSGSSDKTIRLWDAATGQPLGEPLRGHTSSVNAIAFSPDGSRIVSGSSDNTIRSWDAATGQPLGEPLLGHTSSVNAIAFLPDGSQFVSGSHDTTIRLWAKVPDSNASETNQDDRESARLDLGGDLEETPLQILVPGFKACSLLQDGWVQASGKRLFWVPLDNRYGLQNPCLFLSIPTASPLRATKLDFTRFCCGSSWTRVRTDASR
ncbi:hypothetical protein PIIN_05182 [Serendipita indica DSM 11827]|uniref:Nephrocystin 3-like N-terminal domain-containing protein n=1 Tax=Serendipita indica (strain DSM 11827) TaxID=1109443 RepID=G4TIV2_SERID|nr:hypothetical protein PIIN_05182 [Serendipita indica DSM 11827]